MPKIHIIGGPGSGKTYLGEKLSKHFGYDVLDLDNIFWDQNSDRYNTKNDEETRDALLKEFIKKESFITEGVYDKWLGECFDVVDVIIILKPKAIVRSYRIIKRFILRKLGLAKAKKSSLINLINFLIWSSKYEKVNLPRVMELKEKYEEKTHIFSCSDEAFEFLKRNISN